MKASAIRTLIYLSLFGVMIIFTISFFNARPKEDKEKMIPMTLIIDGQKIISFSLDNGKTFKFPKGEKMLFKELSTDSLWITFISGKTYQLKVVLPESFFE
ncbi:MAG: hypothetical protein WCO07_01965 [bacterium]